MKHRPGLDRSQTLLFPERLEDYIAAENPVRLACPSVFSFHKWPVSWQGLILSRIRNMKIRYR
jgi:hypothetical protein